MSIRRVFLDWKRPALPAAADFLLKEFGAGAAVDLSQLTVALPGARAGRRLLELLIERTGERGLAPPRIVTVGALPELLYHPRRPFADSLSQRLAWVRAIQSLPASQRAGLLPVPIPHDDQLAWLAIGELTAHLHRELAAEQLDFPGVVQAARTLEGFDELPRWQALEAAQRAYLKLLDALGLWDLQTARLTAIRQREFRAAGPIVLVGTVDLDGAMRAMFDQFPDRVIALVFAPEEFANRFDAHGCVLPAAWLDTGIELDDAQIEPADSAADQADAVVQQLAKWGPQFAADEITIGAPNESIVPFVVQRLTECGVSGRWGAGLSLPRSAVCRLLEAVADFLENRRFANLAALARHPDLGDWLERQGAPTNWLDCLDDYFTARLPAQVPREWPGEDSAQAVVSRIGEHVERLLRPLAGPPRLLGDWRAAVDEVLLAVYGERPLDRNRHSDRVTLEACASLQAVLDEFARISPVLAPSVLGHLALRLLLDALSGQSVPPAADRDAIELLGWLELPLDDAPALVVTGLNEGYVPAARNADLFLPDALRRRLGLLDNDRRYARDAYALAMLQASRQRLHVIYGRRGVDGEPLVPSRLLLACGDERLAERAQRLFARPPARPRTPRWAAEGGERRPGGFAVPRPPRQPVELDSMRVTEFRDYLACPYRYWLLHRLGLEARRDEGEELDGGLFGDLMHEVLRQFGLGDLRDSTDTAAIAAFLSERLDAEALRRFGVCAHPAVRVQIEQARLRLGAFAGWQARWRANGWRIERVEQDLKSLDVQLPVNGEAVRLRGRIDRIDRHERTGQCVILDYKTGERGDPPDDVHRREGQWIDLQLPLYRHAARALGIQQPVRLGYVLLPKDVSSVVESLAEWTAEDLSGADRVAAAVVLSIRAGEFWEPANEPPAFGAAFAAICQDERFRAAAGNAIPDDSSGEDE